MNTTKASAKNDAPPRSLPSVCAALAVLALVGSTSRPSVPPWRPPCHIVHANTVERIHKDTTYSCVDVKTNARLIIEAGVTLTLDGSDGTTSSIKDRGRIILEGSGATLRISDNDHTFTGNGEIVGQHNQARIEIEDGLTLTNTTTIEGCLEIVPASGASNTTFVNGSDFTYTGLVHANVVGTLDINTNTLGAGDGDWQVSTDNARLEFSVGNTTTPGLGGSFTVSNGTLDIEDNLTGTKAGSLRFTGDYITVDAGVTATFN